ncbi:hypothetical protein PR048_020772 [Dryococelus australis]|uniref:Integrase catalytic domain-containing protein n=1 Tax=Dryococelus australis TaxID=614101 RepID=A0ABQ9GWC1_9NEOP|nr:hypothetical protein PR048_020772 [Dryococelus australis]
MQNPLGPGRFFGICPLTRMSDIMVIGKLKEVFAQFGIPEIVRADNGSQFISSNFHSFGHTYDFLVAAVKVAKSLTKNEDISLALLLYRTTPLDCGFSLAEMLMNHRLRYTLPILPLALEEVIQPLLAPNREHLQNKKQVTNYNRRHRVRHLPDLQVEGKVWISDLRMYDTIVQNGPQPHSYWVHTHRGQYRLNRWFLVLAPFSGEGDLFEGGYVNTVSLVLEMKSVPPSGVDGTPQLRGDKEMQNRKVDKENMMEEDSGSEVFMPKRGFQRVSSRT